MSRSSKLRKIHYWVALPLIATMLVIAVSGSLLAVRKSFASLQPPTRQGVKPGDLRRPVGDLVAAVRRVPGHETVAWTDVDRIDVRPGDGIAKVILKSRTEIQVDLHSGAVLQTGYRTSDWLETIHDFTFVGGWGRYTFSLGSGIALLAMVVTGAYMFALPILVRRRKRRNPRRRLSAGG